MFDLDSIKNIGIIIASLVGIATLFFHYRSSKAVARQQIWISLFGDMRSINDYISENHKELKAPPYPEFKSNQVTAILMLHHVNLAFRFWANRKLMSNQENEGFDRWTKIIFFEWIKNDKSLSRDLVTIVEFKDLYPEDFLVWLKGHSEYQIILRNLNKSS